MSLILPDISGLSQGITGASTAIGQALGQYTQRQRESAGLGIFQQGMTGAEGDPDKILQAYTQALQAGAQPSQLQGLSVAYDSARKQNAFSTALDEAMNFGGIDTPRGKNAFLSAYSKSGGNPIEAMKLFQKDKGGQTVFDKKMDEFKAESVIDYMQGGDQGDMFTQNLDYLQENLPNVGRGKALTGGTAGILGGGEYGPFTSEQFTEYENRGNLVLEGVIKVFNKAGVLPQKKLEWIRKTFAITPFDTQSQIQGKINSLRSLAKDAGSFNQGMGKLIDRYGENIPTEAFMTLQKPLDKATRSFDKQIASPQGEQVVAKLPTKGVKRGQVATNTETGETFTYNGQRWVKKK